MFISIAVNIYIISVCGLLQQLINVGFIHTNIYCVELYT